MNVRPLLVLALCSLAACAKDISDGNGFASGGSATASATGASATGGSAEDSGAETSDSAASASSTGAGTEASLSGATDSTSDTAVVTDTESGDDTTAGSASGETEGETAGQTSSSSTGGGDTAGTALDPELDVPDRGQSCTTPGSSGECPALEVCRFYTAEEGRCETCDNCGNLNAPCSEGTDCDILFACFAGRCTNICPLGTSSCGPVENCLDVGHPSHGVCDPFA